jgi:hypothetical protein
MARWSQDALTWRLELQSIQHSITIIRATWDGAVAVGVKRPAEDLVPFNHLVGGPIANEWRYAEQLAQRLGGYGDVYMTVIVASETFRRRVGHGAVAMGRGPMPLGTIDDHVESLGREFMRSLGNIAPEP